MIEMNKNYYALIIAHALFFNLVGQLTSLGTLPAELKQEIIFFLVTCEKSNCCSDDNNNFYFSDDKRTPHTSIQQIQKIKNMALVNREWRACISSLIKNKINQEKIIALVCKSFEGDKELYAYVLANIAIPGSLSYLEEFLENYNTTLSIDRIIRRGYGLQGCGYSDYPGAAPEVSFTKKTSQIIEEYPEKTRAILKVFYEKQNKNQQRVPAIQSESAPRNYPC